MAYVIAAPAMMTAAAADLAAIGDTLNAAHMTAAAATTQVLPAATDEVSTGIAHLFSQHAANYQALAGQAAAFNNQFVHNLTAGAGAYASAEAANAAFLQDFTIWANFLSESATGWFTFLATTQPSLLFLFLILILFAIIIPLLVAVAIPLLGVALPLVLAVGLPLGIATIALLFGAPILGVAAAELFRAFASFGI